MKYEIGDIVWVKEFEEATKQKDVNGHLFVIIDDDGKVVPADYFGFVVSSNLNKSKENSKFIYNEPIHKNNNNNLKTDSIVKCDQVFSIPDNVINNKIGTVDSEDLFRFLEAYSNFLNTLI